MKPLSLSGGLLSVLLLTSCPPLVNSAAIQPTTAISTSQIDGNAPPSIQARYAPENRLIRRTKTDPTAKTNKKGKAKADTQTDEKGAQRNKKGKAKAGTQTNKKGKVNEKGRAKAEVDKNLGVKMEPLEPINAFKLECSPSDPDDPEEKAWVHACQSCKCKSATRAPSGTHGSGFEYGFEGCGSGANKGMKVPAPKAGHAEFDNWDDFCFKKVGCKCNGVEGVRVSVSDRGILFFLTYSTAKDENTRNSVELCQPCKCQGQTGAGTKNLGFNGCANGREFTENLTVKKADGTRWANRKYQVWDTFCYYEAGIRCHVPYREKVGGGRTKANENYEKKCWEPKSDDDGQELQSEEDLKKQQAVDLCQRCRCYMADTKSTRRTGLNSLRKSALVECAADMEGKEPPQKWAGISIYVLEPRWSSWENFCKNIADCTCGRKEGLSLIPARPRRKQSELGDGGSQVSADKKRKKTSQKENTNQGPNQSEVGTSQTSQSHPVEGGNNLPVAGSPNVDASVSHAASATLHAGDPMNIDSTTHLSSSAPPAAPGHSQQHTPAGNPPVAGQAPPAPAAAPANPANHPSNGGGAQAGSYYTEARMSQDYIAPAQPANPDSVVKNPMALSSILTESKAPKDPMALRNMMGD